MTENAAEAMQPTEKATEADVIMVVSEKAAEAEELKQIAAE